MNYQSVLNATFSAKILSDAKDHARREFPRESCGYVAGGKYIACENEAEEPLKDFIIRDKRYDSAFRRGTVQAIVHSHPNGPIFPSKHDMQQQIATDVPWLIINLNEDQIGDVTAWGDGLPVAPILERPFLHGIFDCYSTVRDVYQAGKDELAKQGIGWPLAPIEMPQVPRDDEWWRGDDDLYADYLAKVGFRPITLSEARPGDGFLIKIGDARGNPKNRLNHAGVLTENDFILHHLPTRLSRREPAGIWARGADLWVRHESSRP
jgi:proteasome lid subunit RPN8/RPN11